MGKSPDAFRTISEVAAQLETPAHVLRFWESKFTQIKPVKRAGGRRYYRPDDIALLGGIKVLLHEKGMTIKGVVNLLKERGVRHVATLSALPWEGLETEEDAEDASESVIVGPWPGAPAQEGSDSVGTESSCDADAGEAESSLIGDFVAGAIARPEAPAALPEAGAKDRSGGLARLRAALAGADRDRLKAQAGQFAPLVERLRALRHAAAEGAL